MSECIGLGCLRAANAVSTWKHRGTPAGCLMHCCLSATAQSRCSAVLLRCASPAAAWLAAGSQMRAPSWGWTCANACPGAASTPSCSSEWGSMHAWLPACLLSFMLVACVLLQLHAAWCNRCIRLHACSLFTPACHLCCCPSPPVQALPEGAAAQVEDLVRAAGAELGDGGSDRRQVAAAPAMAVAGRVVQQPAYRRTLDFVC